MSELTWPEYRDLLADGAPVLLPLGALEQHGPHLPLGTDSLIAELICRRSCAAIGGITAPPVTYGYTSHLRTGGGDGFPGSVNLSGATFSALIREILLELVRHGATRLLVVNGHFENEWFAREACHLAARDAEAAGDEVRIVLLSVWDVRDPAVVAGVYPGSEPLRPELQHASWSETSTALSLFPDLVRRDAFPPDEVADIPSYDVFPGRPEWLPPSGSQSTVSTATAAAGDVLVEQSVAGIVAAARAEFGLPGA